MCLFISANPRRGARASRELARAITEESGLTVRVGKKAFSKILHFSEDEGCACSMMSESADWNADLWDLRPEVLPSLAQAIAALASHHREGFTFEAIWAGDQAKADQEITVTGLLQDIEKNRIKNKVVYRVAPAAQPSPAD